MKSFLHRLLFALAVMMAGLPVLAEGEGNIDISAATGVLTKLKTAIESFWTEAEPFIVSVVGLVVVAALIWAGVRLFKGGTAKISGR